MSAGDPVRLANLRASLRQGTKRTAVPTVAGNGVVAQDRCSDGSRGPTTNRSSSIATVSRSAHRVSASNWREYVEAAAKVMPSLTSKHVTPHSFRHATAVHLVAAGVDITVIRSWLGHVSLDTTNHYAQANLETKAEGAGTPRKLITTEQSHHRGSTTRAFSPGSIPFSSTGNNVEEIADTIAASHRKRGAPSHY